jgi:hypothetical protein
VADLFLIGTDAMEAQPPCWIMGGRMANYGT